MVEVVVLKKKKYLASLSCVLYEEVLAKTLPKVAKQIKFSKTVEFLKIVINIVTLTYSFVLAFCAT